MVLTRTTNHTYSHPFPTVTLAYFLRYCTPQLNPFAKHVMSTDTISSHVDAETGRLHTTRIHLKKSRLPSAVYKLLPSSLTGGAGDKASYVLETSVVDIREGWMQTESRNLNFVGILSVVEKQHYSVPKTDPAPKASPTAGAELPPNAGTTDVSTTVVLRSCLGERIRGKLGQAQAQPAPSESGGFFSRLGTRGIQRSIESLASTKTEDQIGKSREGMRIILERLRHSGVMDILELRRRATERAMEAA